MRHFWLAFVAATFLFCSSISASELVTVVYSVVAGDTMDSIAHSYLPEDRGNSSRAYAEFKEGIFEYNFDRVFIDRAPYEVHAGDYLLITFWE